MYKKKEIKLKLEEKLKSPAPGVTVDLAGKIRRTDEQIEKDRIAKLAITEPNPLFIPLIKAPFDTWGLSIGDDRLKLSDNEARNLALPITQLIDYYLPKIPGIAYVWAALSINAITIMQIRMAIIQELKKKKAETGQKEYPCDKCQAKFANLEDLAAHTSAEHKQ